MNRNPKNQFEKGHAKLPDSGRKPGQQSLVTRMVNEAAVQAAAELGEVRVVPVKGKNGKIIGNKFEWDGKDELVGFFRFAALTETAAFLSILGRTIPTQLNVKQETRKVVVKYASVEDARKALRDRGFDPTVIEAAQKPKFITQQ